MSLIDCQVVQVPKKVFLSIFLAIRFFCHANPVNMIDPSGMIGLVGALTVATIGITLMSIAIPVLGAAYLCIKGDLSFNKVLKHLRCIETWVAAALGMAFGALVGIGINTVICKFVTRLSVQAAKKAMSVVGIIFALAGLAQSIKMTYDMVTGELPPENAELFIATMLAGIILTIVVGKMAKSGKIRKWFKKGSENDAEYWALTPEEQAAYNKGQSLLPTDVHKNLTQGNSVSAAVARGGEIQGNWVRARGF